MRYPFWKVDSCFSSIAFDESGKNVAKLVFGKSQKYLYFLGAYLIISAAQCEAKFPYEKKTYHLFRPNAAAVFTSLTLQVETKVDWLSFP